MCSKRLSVREGEAWITEEHLQIRSLLDQITSADNPFTLLPLLRELRSKLSAHCDREEDDDGLHAIVSENIPEYRDRVDQLLIEPIDEHVDGYFRLTHPLLVEDGRVL